MDCRSLEKLIQRLDYNMRDLKNTISKTDFEEFRKGCHAAFQLVFEFYHRVLYIYVLGYCKKADEAEELVQEAFVTLFLNRSKFKSADGIYPFLFTTIKRLMISSFRKKVVRMKYNEYLKQHWREDCGQTENQLKLTELSGVLETVIETLPERQKEIYTLNKFEDLSYQDIADLLGVSKNTVKNHLIAATRTVREKIEKVY